MAYKHHKPAPIGTAATDSANELSNGPQTAIRLLKRSLYLAAESAFDHALDDIAVRTAVVDHHPDAAEGIAAVREKPEPEFNKAAGTS